MENFIIGLLTGSFISVIPASFLITKGRRFQRIIEKAYKYEKDNWMELSNPHPF